MKHQIAFSTSLCKTIGLSKKKTDAIVAFAVNLLILGYHGCRHVTTASSVVEIEGTFISLHPMSWSESLSFSTCDKKIRRNYFPCRGNSGLVLNTPQMTALHTVAPPGVFFFWQFDFGGDMFFFCLLACVSYWTVKVKCLLLLQLSPSCGARTDLLILRSYDGTTILEWERHEEGAGRKRRRNPFNQPPKGIWVGWLCPAAISKF